MIRGFIAAGLIAWSTAAMAQTPPTPVSPVAPPAAMDSDSGPTRNELQGLLRRYPPQVASVLRLDPTLLGNQAYMSNYPALATFIGQHPEVAHNPRYFFGGDDDRGPGGYTIGREIMSDIGGFMVFVIMTSVGVWVVKTIVEQRRWNRLSTIQTEVHSKLMDRFTSNEELLAYLQSSAGKRFLESAPLPLDAGPRAVSAPVGRILWSVQAGLVMIALGLGFDIVSLRVSSAAAAPLYGIGVTSLLVGLALLVSAAAFYVLSRKFGLLQAGVASSE